MSKEDKRIKTLFLKIEQYLNGYLVTHVTIKYFNELKDLVLKNE